MLLRLTKQKVVVWTDSREVEEVDTEDLAIAWM